MRVTATDESPFDSLQYARVKERNRGIEQVDLPFYHAYVDQMPPGLSAFIVTSDLQGESVKEAAGDQAKVSDEGKVLVFRKRWAGQWH